MAKRNFPNDYYAWYNDDNRIAILELVTSTDSLLTVRLVYLRPPMVVKVSGEPALPAFISMALPFCAAIFDS